MKKFFVAAAFILGVVVSQFVAMSQVEARDEYMGEWEGGWRAYLMTESFNPQMSGQNLVIHCRLKAVKNTTKYFDYEFTYHNDAGNAPLISFRDSSGASGSFIFGSPGVYQVEHKTAVRLLEIFQEIMNAGR